MLKNWSAPNGYRDVLRIGLPMVMSMASSTVMQFTDRVFLANYSVEAIAAALPAGITNFLFLSLFMGVTSYASVFIAQYIGAGQRRRVGAALWQGVYFALGASLVMASLALAAGPIFDAAGHPPEVRCQEKAYFQILDVGAWAVLVSVAFSNFFTGRGRTRPVMASHMLGAALNIPLDYVMIFGAGPVPALGIIGAGWASIIGQTLTMLILALMIFTPKHDRRMGVWRNRAFDRELFSRLMRFGLPGGVHFFLNMFAMTFFVFMIGRLGKIELAATNIALSIDTLAFLPMIGFSVAVSAMVGQAIGRGQPEDGAMATRSTLRLTLCWMGLVVLCFMLLPKQIVGLFLVQGQAPAEGRAILELGTVFLRWVAVYSLLDGITIIYTGALKGAGDTDYVMKAIAVASLLVMVIPVYVLVEVVGAGARLVWPVLTIYVWTLGLLVWLRYRGGKWRGMRVIEK